MLRRVQGCSRDGPGVVPTLIALRGVPVAVRIGVTVPEARLTT